MVVVVVRQAIAFVVGFAVQSLRLTLGLFGLAYVVCLAVRCAWYRCRAELEKLTCLVVALQVTLPPLPAYTAHPVKWLPTLDQYGEPLSPGVGEAETKKDR